MVTFSELGLTEDGKRLVVECSVKNLSIYSGMYIRRILVEYYANALPSGAPSDKVIQIYDNFWSDKSVREVRAVLEASNKECVEKFGISDFSGGLFYVIVECDGELGAAAVSLPCGYDDTTDIGVVLDWCLLHRIGMRHIAAMNRDCRDSCSDITGFEDFVILWHSLRIAAEAADYRMLEKIWGRFLRIAGTPGASVTSGCGCGKR